MPKPKSEKERAPEGQASGTSESAAKSSGPIADVRHADGCPAADDGTVETLVATRDGLEVARVDRTETYDLTAPDGATVAIKRCVECGAHEAEARR